MICGTDISHRRFNAHLCGSKECRYARAKITLHTNVAVLSKHRARCAEWKKDRRQTAPLLYELEKVKNRQYMAKRRKTDAGYRQKKRVENLSRRAKQRGLSNGLTLGDWRRAIQHFQGMCAYCGNPMTDIQKEHFIPLSRGGGFSADNIVPACRACNLDKSNKDPFQWLAGRPSVLWGVTAYLWGVTP